MEAQVILAQAVQKPLAKGSCRYTVQIAATSDSAKSYKDLIKDLLIQKLKENQEP